MSRQYTKLHPMKQPPRKKMIRMAPKMSTLIGNKAKFKPMVDK